MLINVSNTWNTLNMHVWVESIMLLPSVIKNFYTASKSVLINPSDRHAWICMYGWSQSCYYQVWCNISTLHLSQCWSTLVTGITPSWICTVWVESKMLIPGVIITLIHFCSVSANQLFWSGIKHVTTLFATYRGL